MRFTIISAHQANRLRHFKLDLSQAGDMIARVMWLSRKQSAERLPHSEGPLHADLR